MTKPTIVLVPGAWVYYLEYIAGELLLTTLQHIPEHFAQVQNILEDEGYACVGVHLPSNAHEPYVNGRLVDFNDDVSTARQVITEVLDAGSDVVVVVHSYGTLVGTAALKDLSPDTRKAAGHTNGVKALVIIAGFVLPEGISMLQAMGGQLPPQYLHEGDTTLPFAGPGAIEVLYNDLDTLDAQKAIWRLKPQSYAINTTPMPGAAASLRGIPLSYLACDKDNACPYPIQIQTIDALKAMDQSVYAEVAPTGHSPFIRMPEETARFVRRAAGEDVQSGFKGL